MSRDQGMMYIGSPLCLIRHCIAASGAMVWSGQSTLELL